MPRLTIFFIPIVLLFCLTIGAAYGAGYYLFVGTYTNGKAAKGIYVYRFNSETGELVRVSNGHRVVNPSYLTISPDGKYLYACTETKLRNKGSASAFSFDSITGQLTFLNK